MPSRGASLDRRSFVLGLCSVGAVPWLASGCRPSPIARRGPVRRFELEPRLLVLASELERDFGGAQLLAESIECTRAVHSDDESWTRVEVAERLILRAGTGDGARITHSASLSEGDIAEAVDRLRGELGGPPKTRRGTMNVATWRRFGRSPTPVGDGALPRRAAELHRELAELRGSRLIHRTAGAELQRRRRWWVGGQRALSEELLLGRAGAEVVAWTGSGPSSAAMQAGGADGARSIALPEGGPKSLAEWALTPLTARQPPIVRGPVILSPEVAVQLIDQCVRPCLEEPTWSAGSVLRAQEGEAVAGAALRLSDLPGDSSFGVLHFDDDGVVSAPLSLIDAGVLRNGLTGSRRRIDAELQQGSISTHLRVSGPTPMAAPLWAGVKEGVAVFGPIAASVDPFTGHLNLQVQRGLAIADGTTTGRLYGDLEIRGSLVELLASIDAVGSESVSVPVGDAGIRPRAITCPSLRITAEVGPA